MKVGEYNAIADVLDLINNSIRFQGRTKHPQIPEQLKKCGVFLRSLQLTLSPTVSQGWSLQRIARLCGCNGATSTCPSTASCPPSPSWACSWQGPSSSSTSRTAITGRQTEGGLLVWGGFGTCFVQYSGLFQANQDVQSIHEQPDHPGGHAVLRLHLPLWSGWRFCLR